MIRLVQGDNLEAIHCLQPGSVTLAYLDPPFFTGREFIHADGRVAFQDTWDSLEQYIETLASRLHELLPKLAPWGCCVVHVDPRTAAYVRVAGDRVFGYDRFASEIIWRYRRWPTRQNNFQKVHDVLLRWVKDRRASRWNPLYEPRSPGTIKTHGPKKQHHVWIGGTRRKTQWSELDDDSPGTAMGDVWELSIVAPVAKERTGYPTQKPEALLERLIRATTNTGDLVLDPYCGSGTTLAVAQRLGRNGIGIDSSSVAIDVARKRLGLNSEAA